MLDVEAKLPQLEVPPAVILKCDLSAVVSIAIGFDHEPLVSPEEIDEKGADADIDLGQRNAVTAAEAQEGGLEIATGSIGCVSFVDGQTQHIRLPDSGT